MPNELKTNRIQYFKDKYKPGTRIEMTDNMVGENIRAGERGTVTFVDDIGDVFINWDNGGSLALIPHLDKFMVITPEYEQANPAKPIKRAKQPEHANPAKPTKHTKQYDR